MNAQRGCARHGVRAVRLGAVEDQYRIRIGISIMLDNGLFNTAQTWHGKNILKERPIKR